MVVKHILYGPCGVANPKMFARGKMEHVRTLIQKTFVNQPVKQKMHIQNIEEEITV